MAGDHINPRRVSRDPTLFQQSLPEMLKAVGTSLHQVQEWRARGWLSFELKEQARYDQWHFEEVRFINSLVQSGMGEIIVQHLLDKLSPPYSYSSDSIAYCFGRGQWVRVFTAPDVDQVIEDNWELWLSALADSDGTEILADIAQYVQALIGPQSGSAENKDKSS